MPNIASSAGIIAHLLIGITGHITGITGQMHYLDYRLQWVGGLHRSYDKATNSRTATITALCAFVGNVFSWLAPGVPNDTYREHYFNDQHNLVEKG